MGYYSVELYSVDGTVETKHFSDLDEAYECADDFMTLARAKGAVVKDSYDEELYTI